MPYGFGFGYYTWINSVDVMRSGLTCCGLLLCACLFIMLRMIVGCCVLTVCLALLIIWVDVYGLIAWRCLVVCGVLLLFNMLFLLVI